MSRTDTADTADTADEPDGTDATGPAPDTPAPSDAGRHTPVGRTVGIAVALTGVVALIVLAFTWPAMTAQPRDVALAVVGPDPAVTQIESRLDQQAPGTFEVTGVDTREQAVAGIESREFLGAVVPGPAPEVLSASANGAVNQVITRLAGPLGAQVTDVVAFSPDDPGGRLLTSATFPMLIGGIIGGVALSTAVVGSGRRILGLAVYSVVGGLVLTAILQGWFGAIQGDFLLNVAAFALAMAAISAPMIGFVALIGRAGIAVGPVVMMLFANPISGATLPAQFLPGAWGTIGQWFPPGAASTVVRELSYFPEAVTAFPWLVLIGWTVAGVLLSVIGHARVR